MKKQILSLVVVICMLLVCIPFTAVANEATGNITVLYIEGVDALANPNGDGWSFDASTGTLTLTDCNLTQGVEIIDQWEDVIYPIIYVMGDLTIELVGDNVIRQDITIENENEYRSTTYAAIYSDYYWDENDNGIGSITFTGNGTLSIGISMDPEAYHEGNAGVSWSCGIMTSNPGGVDFTALGENGKVEVFGGVVGEPGVYNIKAFSSSPTYNEYQLVFAFQDIEATMPNDAGYNWNNNDAWNFQISNGGAGIAGGMFYIVNDSPSSGDGWSWQNNVLTLDSMEFKQLDIGYFVSSTKIVLNGDVTIDTDENWNAAITNEGGPLEICTGEHILTAYAWDSYIVECYNNLTISEGTVNLINVRGNAWGYGMYINGDFTINDATFTLEGGPIELYGLWDNETGEYGGGNVYIENSDVTVDACYEDQSAFSVNMVFSAKNSTVNVNAANCGIYANFTQFEDSTVNITAGDAAIDTYQFSVFSSEVSLSGTNGAIFAGSTYEGPESVNTEAIYLDNAEITTPTDVSIGMYEDVDYWGDSYYSMTVFDADGNIATDVVIKAQKPIEYNIINGKLVITVITEAGFNRVALYNENNVCIETTNSYVLNGDKYIWTITTSAPSTESTYVVKARDAATNSYKNGITFDAFTVIPEVVIESVETQIRGDRVYVTVTTVSENYDRVAVYNASSGACVKYTKNYEEVDGTYVWTIVFNYDESTRDYIVRARDIRTGTYNKAQEVALTISVRVEPIIDVQITEYDEENILITVTTIPDIYRVKVADAEAPSSCISYARTPATRGADNWTWEIIVPRFEDGGYAIDVAYTKAAYARYYTYIAY